MNKASIEFNTQLALDVLLHGLTEITSTYVTGAGAICVDMDEVVIPDQITYIGSWAFWQCNGLTNVTIPDSVTEIGEYAFEYSYGLTNMTIPASVTEIGEGAFYNCKNLISVVFKGKTLEEVRSMKNYPWYIPSEKISVQMS